MLEFIGLTLGGLAVLGALVLGYAAWRTKRREEDAAQQDDPDKKAQRPIWRPK